MRNDKFSALWKAKKAHSTLDHVVYAIVKATSGLGNDKVAMARGCILSAFTPITNTNKLTNGISSPFVALEKAMDQLLTLTLLAPEKIFGFEALDENQRKVFTDVLKELRKEPFVDTTYAYFVVRQDISREQQLVQTAHVAMALGQKYRTPDAHGLSFVVFGVPTKVDLVMLGMNLEIEHEIDTTVFFEPDINGGEPTAIALPPMRKSVAARLGIFDQLSLLTLEDHSSFSQAFPPAALAAVS